MRWPPPRGRVGGEQHLRRRGGLLFQVIEYLRAAPDGDVFRPEAVLHVDREPGFRKIDDMAHRRRDDIFFAEVLVDRLCLGGRFDDDKRFSFFIGHAFNLPSA